MRKKTFILTITTLVFLGVSPLSTGFDSKADLVISSLDSSQKKPLLQQKSTTPAKEVLNDPPKSANGYELGSWVAAKIARGGNQTAKVDIANSAYSKLDQEQKIKSLASVPSIIKHLDYNEVRETISISMRNSGHDFRNSITFEALKSIVEYSHGDKDRLAVIKGDFHDLAPGLFFELAPGLFSGL